MKIPGFDKSECIFLKNVNKSYDTLLQEGVDNVKGWCRGGEGEGRVIWVMLGLEGGEVGVWPAHWYPGVKAGARYVLSLFIQDLSVTGVQDKIFEAQQLLTTNITKLEIIKTNFVLIAKDCLVKSPNVSINSTQKMYFTKIIQTCYDPGIPLKTQKRVRDGSFILAFL